MPSANGSLYHLSDKGRSRARLVLPVGWQLTAALVVASKAVDTGLDKN